MSYSHFISRVLLVIPVLLVGTAVLYYANNLPYWDDYMVQEHLLKLRSIPSTWLRFDHLFDQHWEHRIIWTRLVFGSYFLLTGSLNYVGLTFIGFLGLLGGLGVLYAAYRRIRTGDSAVPLAYFLPVPFLMLTLQSYENLLWSMASLQHFYVLFFGLGVYYLLALPGRYNWLAGLALALLAGVTSGNGLLVPVAAVAVLACQNRPWPVLLSWSLATALLFLAYFYHYQRIDFFPAAHRYAYTEWVKSFFVFLGGYGAPFPYASSSLLGTTSIIKLTFALGFLLAAAIALLLFISLRTLTRTNRHFWASFFMGSILFLLGTALLTVYTRVGFDGALYMLQGRYRIYSALAISLTYLYGLSLLQPEARRRAVAGGVTLLVLPYSLFTSYLCLDGLLDQHRRTIAAYYNYLVQTPAGQQRAIQTVFRPTSEPFFMPDTAQIRQLNWRTAPTTTRIDSVQEHLHFFHLLKTDAVNPSLTQPDDGSYVLALNDTHTYLFAAKPERRSLMAVSGFADYFLPNRLGALVPKESMAPGTYRLGFLVRQGGTNQLLLSDRFITNTGL